MRSEGYCLSVCLSVCLSPLVNISRLECLFVLKTRIFKKDVTYSTGNVSQNYRGISLKPLRCGDPTLPALYGYSSSAMRKNAHALPPRVHVVHVRGHFLPVALRKTWPHKAICAAGLRVFRCTTEICTIYYRDLKEVDQ